MAKRSTIGTNPLDVAVPNPLEGTLPDQHEETKPSTHRDGEKQGSADSSVDEHSSATFALQAKDNTAHQKPPTVKGGGPQGKSTTHQKDVAQASQSERDVLSHSDTIGERLSELEHENLCLKWALALILAPFALLALLG